MNFVPYAELVRDALALARRFEPGKVRGVLGVPRSGMIPASIIAQELGCHLGDVDTFASTGSFHRPGRRFDWASRIEGPILVVDDSVHSGAAMREAREILEGAEMATACVYLRPGMEAEVDVFARRLASPRLFGWNWTASVLLSRCLTDLDGIICTDSDVFDDDGPEYEQALRDVRPLHLPRRRLRGIVTARLERWRDLTVEWLDVHGVDRKRLEMAPFPRAAVRRQHGNARWKASVYADDTDALLFIESSRPQAKEIARRTERPVLCLPDEKVYR